MQQTLKLLAGSLFIFSVLQSSALDLTKINLEYHYDLNALVRLNYRVVQNDSSLIVFCKTKMPVAKSYDFTLLVQDSYKAEAHDTLTNYSLDTLKVDVKQNTIKLEIFEQIKNKLVVIVFSDPSGGSDLFFDVPLFAPQGYPEFYPIGPDSLPIINTFITESSIGFAGTKNNEYHVYEYNEKFIGADPPMGAMKPISPTLSIDSSYIFRYALDELSEDNFYLFQEDSLSQTGLTMLKVPSYYPATKRLDDLIGPLQYITTSDENKSLNRSEGSAKPAFERFWINTYGTKFRAKGAIRTFYTLVQESNELFTDYKAGWKTDRGMVYIVYGKPDIVVRQKGLEIWKYSSGIEFEFIRISTLFAPFIYSLKRNIDYEDDWYDRVGEIRNG